MIVDARGHLCPVPSLKLAKAMKLYPPKSRVTLLATDPMARIDVPHMMRDLGGTVVSITQDQGVLTLIVETPAVPTD